MPSTIFAGSKVKALKSTLSLNGGADIISSATNPQTSAVSAEPGSLLLNTTSGTMYRKLDSGSSTNWVEVGAGTGGKNYIKNPDFDGGATTNWGLFNTTLTSQIPTGSITAGAVSITSFAADSTTPIEGAYDLRVGSSGAITAGHGFISDAFTIDREDYAKVLGFSFAYEAISGTMNFSGTSANTWAVYIYDVDGAAWIQPAGVYNLVQGSGVGIASGTFQTTATGTQYRIAVICITATSGAVEMRFDDFQLGPQKVLAGAAVSDWVSYTPTAQGFTASAIEGKWRRVGDSVEVKARAVMSGTTGGAYSISAPFVADTAKFPGSLPNNFYGTGGYYDLNLNQGYIGTSFVTSGASPVIGVYGPAGSQWQVSTVPVGFGVGDIFTVDITYPVQGWSSSVQMSNDTDTRIVAARYEVSGARSGALSGAVVNYDTKIIDTHSAVTTGASWSFRAPISGIYRVTGQIEGNSSGAGLLVSQIRKNGTVLSSGTFPVNSATNYCAPQAEAIVSCNAGDLIDIYESPTTGSWTKGGIPATNYVNIERLSGPATIAASETVSCVYSSNTATVIGTTATTIPFEDRDFDTHGFYNPSSGIATIPTSGKYLVVCGTYYNSSAQGYSFSAVQGGSVSKTYRLGEKTTSTSTGFQIVGSAEFNCLAGDTLRIQATASAGGVGLFPLNELNHLSIIRVGN